MLEKTKDKIELQHVELMPKELEGGILYVSIRFQVATHLCPCGCRTKIVTPIGPADWKFSERNGLPSLDPSIGNWQIPCQSHYWITDGEIRWSHPWTKKQIEEGWKRDQEKRELYYQEKAIPKKKSLWRKFIDWFFNR